MLSAKTIIVLGGTGLLGSAILRHLCQHSPHLRLISVARHSPQDPISGVEYRRGDLLEAKTLPLLLSDAEVVLNCSGWVSFFRKDRASLESANVHAVQHLVAALNSTPGIQKCIHISSAAAFGAQDGAFTEDSPRIFQKHHETLLPYAYSKFLGDQAFLKARFPHHVLFLPFLTNHEWKKRSLARIQKLPFFPAPDGSNGFLSVQEAAEKIVHILFFAPAGEHFLLSGETVAFAEIPKKWKIVKYCLLIPRSLGFWCVKIASVLESFGIPISAEKAFFAFRRRDPQESKFARYFPECTKTTKRSF